MAHTILEVSHSNVLCNVSMFSDLYDDDQISLLSSGLVNRKHELKKLHTIEVLWLVTMKTI